MNSVKRNRERNKTTWKYFFFYYKGHPLYSIKIRHELLNSELTFKVHLAVAICVEYVDDSLDQRVLLELGQGHELLDAQRTRVIQVEFLKPLA